MSDYWIKLYVEVLDDPKMATLPDRLWRRTVEIFLAAGKLGNGDRDGNIPDTPQLAWLLRIPTDELALDLQQIASTGIIQKTVDGWQVSNFAKRQSATPAADRKRIQRERGNRSQYYGDNVTSLSRNVTQINRLTDNRLTDNRLTETEGVPTTASAKISPAEMAQAVEAWNGSSHTQACVQLYQKVTGQMAIPASQLDGALTNLQTVIDNYGDVDTAVEDGKRVFGTWCTTRGKSGHNYSPVNCAWLERWLDVMAPQPKSNDNRSNKVLEQMQNAARLAKEMYPDG